MSERPRDDVDRALEVPFTPGMDMEGVANVDTQLQMIHDEVIPAV